MVKLSEDGTFVFAGDHVTHASLDALVTFHQQNPIRPHGELLIRACGQKDPASVDYEDLFLYWNALVQDNGRQLLRMEVQRPSSGSPEEASEEKPSTTTEGESALASCSTKALFEESGQKLWKNLRSLPQTSRKVKQRLTSNLSAMNLLGNARRVAQQHHSPVTRAFSWDGASHSEDPCAATTSLQNPAQPEALRDREATFRDSKRTSWREALSGVKAWHGKVIRGLSAPESANSPEAQGWLPEEYLPPPPFAPGY